MLRALLLLVSFMVAGVAYFLYIPAPSFVIKKVHWHFVTAVLKLTVSMGSLLDRLGICHKMAPFQSLTFLLRNKFLDNTTDMTVSVRHIKGVRTFVLKPSQPQNLNGRGLIYFHGGGFVIGVPDMYRDLLELLVVKLNFIVYAPEYRKAPEHLFPAGFDDCYSVAEEIMRNSADFGVDVSRTVIGGDSAGGQLAAAVTMRLLGAGAPLPRTQLLIYPVLQFANFQTPSYQSQIVGTLDKNLCLDFTGLYLLGATTHSNALSRNAHVSKTVAKRWKSLFKEQLIQDGVESSLASQLEERILDPRLSPLLVPDLSGLPLTYILTAQYDPLHWDGVRYAQRLREADVKVFHRDYNTFHGALSTPGDGDILQKDMLEFLADNV